MKKILSVLSSTLLTAFALTVVSFSGLALDRSVIADKAENVTPLLNGASAPNVTLKMTDGTPVSLKALTMQKPTVLIFYRGGWCPYCSRQLAELKSIEQPLVDAGYQVLAVSPESPTKLQEQKLETEFLVQLLSDDSLEAIRGFGIGFYVPDDTRKLYKNRMNVDLTADSNERAVLPAPAIFILDQQGKIQFNYVNPDFATRPSAELVLAAAKLVKKQKES